MYEKNLTEDMRLRLSKNDMDFLRELSAKRSVSVSECIRSIIGEYRRGIEMMNTMTEMINLTKEAKLSHGDTETHLDNLV